ncbi:nicotinate dehydrogenase subunit A [Gemmobacter aquatilis]|uniref:Nicotinate dehydrogenase subunit A n=1 Tax=Gemmobacter aquatilis TaxID=933059 RepID=A0A1H7Y6K0_9RHOB|nr:(2Fe-2S)-binding protein [Gemmobacter aquatilis]SEM41772.1 nicotinate dehydrogenase subunit A [Gemmobacter aquatilis]
MGLSFTLNGHPLSLDADDKALLLDVLRQDLGLTGPKYGCGLAQCGACTVLVDGKPARSCVLRAARVAGCHVTTLEGLADPQTGALHPVQQGFLEKQGAQCGYCLNGMVMSAVAFLAHTPAPTEAELRHALRDNLCRCGTHQEIIAAVLRAAELLAASGESRAHD